MFEQLSPSDYSKVFVYVLFITPLVLAILIRGIQLVHELLVYMVSKPKEQEWSSPAAKHALDSKAEWIDPSSEQYIKLFSETKTK